MMDAFVALKILIRYVSVVVHIDVIMHKKVQLFFFLSYFKEMK